MTTEQPETDQYDPNDPQSWDAEDALEAVSDFIKANPSAADYQILAFIERCRVKMGYQEEDTSLADQAKAAYLNLQPTALVEEASLTDSGEAPSMQPEAPPAGTSGKTPGKAATPVEPPAANA